MIVEPIDRGQLADATRVLAVSCEFDRAASVAEETLFGPAPLLGAPPTGLAHAEGSIEARAFGAREGGELLGVAAVAGKWLRVVAVVPAARRRGIGTALVDACVAAARTDGQQRLRTVGQPGNYLAPGIDVRNVETIAWLERHGWARAGELRANVLIDVQGNPRVTVARAAELAEAARAKGYEIRRARADETALLDAVDGEFGGAWPFELARALGHAPVGVHVALRDGAYCAVAAHDGNNRGLGWFGPTGTWPAHRGKGLGEALLVACLVDVGVDHAQCEVAWIGPRPFYDKVAGVAADRAFVVLARDL